MSGKKFYDVDFKALLNSNSTLKTLMVVSLVVIIGIISALLIVNSSQKSEMSANSRNVKSENVLYNESSKVLNKKTELKSKAVYEGFMAENTISTASTANVENVEVEVEKVAIESLNPPKSDLVATDNTVQEDKLKTEDSNVVLSGKDSLKVESKVDNVSADKTSVAKVNYAINDVTGTKGAKTGVRSVTSLNSSSSSSVNSAGSAKEELVTKANKTEKNDTSKGVVALANISNNNNLDKVNGTTVVDNNISKTDKKVYSATGDKSIEGVATSTSSVALANADSAKVSDSNTSSDVNITIANKQDASKVEGVVDKNIGNNASPSGDIAETKVATDNSASADIVQQTATDVTAASAPVVKTDNEKKSVNSDDSVSTEQYIDMSDVFSGLTHLTPGTKKFALLQTDNEATVDAAKNASD